VQYYQIMRTSRWYTVAGCKIELRPKHGTWCAYVDGHATELQVGSLWEAEELFADTEAQVATTYKEIH
jgi:hypothetical protein